MAAVSAKLSELYGARMEAFVRKRGEVLLTGLISDVIDERFAGDGEPLTRENYGALMDRIDAYLSEFDQHGTDNISVDLDE